MDVSGGLNVDNLVDNDGSSAKERVRKYFREVVDKHKLPSLPVVAGKVLELIRDPDISTQKLCRVLSDDAALAAKVLAASRSPHFAQRTLPTNLVSAVQVLGFQNLTNLIVANATHSLCLKGNAISEKLWNHSLAVALATRILCLRAGFKNAEQAFLAGLLHDVGEMILVHGDSNGFAKLGGEVQQANCQMIDKEQEFYGFDHTLIGLTLLDSWNLDGQIGQAVLNHHSDVSGDNANHIAAMIAMADYCCGKIDLGLFAAPPQPPVSSLAICGCDSAEAMAETLQAIREAYDNESALFRPA
jgi:putative nucleotidyltransferase with HDIG domain